MKKFLSSVVLLNFVVFQLLAFQIPCEDNLNIGDDINLCGTEFIQLVVPEPTNFISVQWEPAALFSNANSLTTVAAISESTTIRVQVRELSNLNLVQNGGFELGDQDFSSDYIYGTGGGVGLLSNEGQYAIATNAGDTHNHFDNCNDHTVSGNMMMVVNASGLANSVWCQTITVTENTEYEFGAWLTSVTDQNPAQLQFSINGLSLGDVLSATTNTCSWQEFTANWMSGLTTEAEICINNVNLTPNGNDFAIDDISFRTICVLEDELIVNVGHADATWYVIADLCENNAALALNGLIDIDGTIGGTWMLNGIEVDGSVPTLLDVGQNEVSYAVTDGICSDQLIQFIEVGVERLTGIPNNPLIICEGELDIINLFDFIDGEDTGGTWNQTAGPTVNVGVFNNMTGEMNISNEIIGNYEFTYSFDFTFQCPGFPSTISIEILPSPIADAGENQSITCAISSVALGGDNTSSGLDFIYRWIDVATGDVVHDELTLEVLEVGTFELQVEDTRTGCIASDEVTVTSSVTTLEISAHGEALGCQSDENGQVIIDEVFGGVAPYLFSLDGGDFIATDSFTGLISGDYVLRVMDVTGCMAEVEVSIFYPNALIAVIDQNTGQDRPLITLGDSLKLTVNTSLNENLLSSIIWTPNNTNCIGCSSITVHPTTQPSTTYSVTVLDENGCSASATIIIDVQQIDDVFVPNAFSPNDDGVNDVFYVNTGASVAEIETFLILDRWGDLVFSKEHILPNTSEHGWNGMVAEKYLPNGVYVYILNLKLVDGKSVTQSGDVILLR